MDLKKYKELFFCLALLMLPSLAGCFSSTASSLESVESAMENPMKAAIDQAILSSYSVETSFLSHLSSSSVLGDSSLLNAGVSLSDASYAGLELKLAVYPVDKEAMIHYLSSKFDAGSFEHLKAFLEAKKASNLEAYASVDNNLKFASLYFDHLVAKHIIIKRSDADAYIVSSELDTDMQMNYVLFTPKRINFLETLAKDLNLDLLDAKVKEELELLVDIFFGDIVGDDTYQKMKYVSIRAPLSKIKLIKEGPLFMTSPVKLPVGKMMVTKFALYNDADKSIYAVPTKDSLLATAIGKENALPWVETIEKDKSTVRSASKVKVVRTSSMELASESGHGLFTLGFEAVENYRWVNFDLIPFEKNGASYDAVSEDFFIYLYLRYKKLDKENPDADSLGYVTQTLKGTTSYTNDMIKLSSLNGVRTVLNLPDYYTSNPDDTSGFVEFSIEASALGSILKGATTMPFKAFLEMFPTVDQVSYGTSVKINIFAL